MRNRVYIVMCGRGRLRIVIPQSVIDLRGEDYAVKQRAWQVMMGENELGEVIDKNSPTRKELRTQCNSRYGGEPEVFSMFVQSIKYQWVGLE